MKIVVKMYFGFRLYGTATPESDTDVKGVFLPSLEQVLLNRVPRTFSTATKANPHDKNAPEDVDTDLYSLHYFIDLACAGETVALDMLHAPPGMLLQSSDLWDEIVGSREKFYTRNLKAFIGYARRQAAKYGVKGSRLASAKAVLAFLEELDPSAPLSTVWDRLPLPEHVHHLGPNPNGIREYQVCGKKFQETSKIEYILPTLRKFCHSYGDRARQAERNEGIDWKAVSHAIRAALQVKQILEEGTLTFPLREAAYLRAVKKGELHYQNEVAPRLDELMEEVEKLSAESSLPLKPDRRFWDDFILRTLLRRFGEEIRARGS